MSKEHIVLMPGLDGTGKSFEPVLPLIAADAHVTVIRYPSDRPLSFEQTVACAAQQIPRESSPVIIAESFSGPVAIRMIAAGLVSPKALVLCATFVRSPHPVLWRLVRFLRLPLAIRPDMPHSFFKFVIGPDPLIETLKPLWKKVHAEVSPRIMDSRLALINTIDVTGDLQKLTLPCLCLQAAYDRILPSSCLEDIACRIPHLQVKYVDGPHFILQAAPDNCLQAIENFIKDSGTK